MLFLFIRLCIVFRHVILPQNMAKHVPRNHLMTETEWRNLGVQQSPHWVHYMVHIPGMYGYDCLSTMQLFLCIHT